MRVDGPHHGAVAYDDGFAPRVAQPEFLQSWNYAEPDIFVAFAAGRTPEPVPLGIVGWIACGELAVSAPGLTFQAAEVAFVNSVQHFQRQGETRGDDLCTLERATEMTGDHASGCEAGCDLLGDLTGLLASGFREAYVAIQSKMTFAVG